MKLRTLLVPAALALSSLAPIAAHAQAATDTTAAQPKPHGGALKGAVAGGAVSKLSGGSATKGAALGAGAGAIVKHESKKNIARTGQS